jgi:hypothetical protein
MADVTEIFWPFVDMLRSMTFDDLKSTKEFDAFNKLQVLKSSFALHMGCVEDLDASVFYDALPLGIWVENEWMYFADINRLFYGMQEIYERENPSKRRTMILEAVVRLQHLVQIQEAMDMMDAIKF